MPPTPPADRADREGRCPDGGYCHGSTLVAGSTPCDAGACYRVRHAGPLSGVYPGDRWPDELREQAHEHEHDRAAVLGGYGLPAARAQAAEREQATELALVEPEVVEGELLDAVDPHGVKATDRGAIVALVCRCGQWEAAAGGPSSLAWAARDHRRHVAEATGRA